MDKLRETLADYGTEKASSLLLVSGVARQVVLNSLSQHAVDLLPLDEKTLFDACAYAFDTHCGETRCIRSNINGGGKTHHILSLVAERQKQGEPISYKRIPFRESSSAASCVQVLSCVPQDQATAFHFDIGHIIPAEANTLLFELLIIGVLKDIGNNRVYHRSRNDLCLLEIPNSRGGIITITITITKRRKFNRWLSRNGIVEYGFAPEL